jgi:hypothetical protein
MNKNLKFVDFKNENLKKALLSRHKKAGEGWGDEISVKLRGWHYI